MSKVLILAEKPSQARDYAKVFRCQKREGYFDCGNVLITWAFGHLFEIDDSIAPKEWNLESLPIFPQYFKLKLRKGVKKQFEVISKLLGKVEEIWIGTDPGREGELIAREILLVAGWKNWKKVKRIWTSEALTSEVVKKALKNLKPSSEFDSLYFSALARQHADWIVGINLTRLVSLKSSDGSVWSVGRVQTPTLRLIVEREKEIENFKPQPYFLIKALFEKEGKNFEGILVLSKEDFKNLIENKEEDEEETKKEVPGIKDKSLAFKIFKEIKDTPEGIVSKVFKKTKNELPPLLHSLTTLQREANKLYGFSAQKTLQIAQKLYEEHKIISYPRTDSQYLAESNKPLVKEVLRKLGREDLIIKVDRVGKRVFDDRKLTDHHAIIPLDKLKSKLTKDEEKIYNLILRRFLGAFMKPYEYEITTVLIKVKDYTFVARGKVDITLGWKELYKEKEEKSNLPILKKGQIVKKLKTSVIERKTSPPPRYTEGMLLKKMEKLGLGTPATRSQIIETLKERGYVVLKGKSLIPTDKGKELINNLSNSEVSSPEMTSRWEEELENIYRKNLKEEGYKKFLERIKEFTKEEVEKLKSVEFKAKKQATPKMLKLAKALSKETGLLLPKETDFETVKTFIEKALKEKERQVKEGIDTCKCGGKIVRFSKGFKCQGCNSIVWETFFGKKITKKQAIELLKGKEVILKGLKGKSGKKFNARVRLNGNRLEIVEFVM